MIGKNQCEHGALKRSCLTCELQAEIVKLEKEREAYRKGWIELEIKHTPVMSSHGMTPKRIEAITFKVDQQARDDITFTS